MAALIEVPGSRRHVSRESTKVSIRVGSPIICRRCPERFPTPLISGRAGEQQTKFCTVQCEDLAPCAGRASATQEPSTPSASTWQACCVRLRANRVQLQFGEQGHSLKRLHVAHQHPANHTQQSLIGKPMKLAIRGVFGVPSKHATTMGPTHVQSYT